MQIRNLNGISRISQDFILNILASILLTAARQIVVFPVIANTFTDSEYGTVLTVVGIVNVCTAVVGSSLNNIRLIQNPKYEGQKLCGDFNLLCFCGSLIEMFVLVFISKLYALTNTTLILLIVYVFVSNFYQYGIVFFRLVLNFRQILACNTIVSVIYVLSVFVFSSLKLWPLIFIAGDSTGLVYVCMKTRFYKGELKTSVFFKDTIKMFAAFILMNIIGNLLTYADRMVIYPVLGAESVSYYSTAAFFGKSAGILMTPIAGVLLGYFTQPDFKPTARIFTVVNISSLAILSAFLAVCVLVGPWFTRILYPSLFEQSSPYIFLANLAAVISIASSMSQPMVLKTCPIWYNVLISLVYGIVYLSLAVKFMSSRGLNGFCWAAIIANATKLIMLYAIGYIRIGKTITEVK